MRRYPPGPLTSNRMARQILLLAAATLLALPGPARPAEPSGGSGPSGLVVSATLGGGGQLGAGSAYSPPSVFELEAGVAYELFAGIAPQLTMVLGMSPGTSFAIRPGLEWFVPDTPFYLRAAFDASTQIGYLNWRWLLLGGGFDLRITDVFGVLVELDSGVPLAYGVGVPLLVRAGAFARF